MLISGGGVYFSTPQGANKLYTTTKTQNLISGGGVYILVPLSGSLQSQATDFGRSGALTWDWGLQSGSLESRATNFASSEALTWDWESTVWESTVSSYRFWIQRRTHLGLGVYILGILRSIHLGLGVYSLGVYSFGLPILDAAEHSPGTGSLQFGSLHCRATDFRLSGALTWD